jgi:nitric oxide dioxygenase
MTTDQLSQSTIDTVRATAPVLAEHGVAIVTAMYRNMFREHPEIRPYFNQANQSAEGEKTRASQIEAFRDQVLSTSAVPGRQVVSLAQAILAYANNIDNLAVLTPAVLRIANKHASLHILPEHYPIVGKHILGAIKEVLGDAATDPIIEAWGEAYGFLANIFIKLEDQLRSESASKAGGWQGFRRFTVARKVKESDDVCSFYLKPEDGGPLPSYKAGQYTSFRLEVPEHGSIRRTYTLSSAPGKDYLRVSIKSEPGAGAHPEGLCSNYFHKHVKEGDVLEMAPPYGDFARVTSDRPIVLIAAGVGVTPMFSMLQSAVDEGAPQPIHFVECMRSGRQHPLKAEVRELVKQRPSIKLHTFYSEPDPSDRLGEDYTEAGRLTLERLKAILPDNDAEFYFTGPVKFMRSLRGGLHQWGVPADRVHYECFGPMASEVEADVQ